MQPDQTRLSYTTIGSLDEGSDAKRFLDWAEKRGLTGPAVLLINTLLLSKNSRHLVDVLHLLGRGRPHLLGWKAAGDQLWGMAEISAHLEGTIHEAVLSAPRIQGRKATADLPGLSQTHYLQLALMTRPLGWAAENRAPFEIMQLWLLIEALDRAMARNYSDQLLLTCASGLRLVAESPVEPEHSPPPFGWGSVARHLKPAGSSLSAVRLYLMSQARRLHADRLSFPSESTPSRFFDAVACLAAGESRPLSTSSVLLLQAPGNPSVTPTPEVSGLNLPDEWEPNAFEPPAAPLTDGDDDDVDPSASDVPTNPSKSAAEQESEARYIQIVSGDHARLISWSWDRINPRELHQLRRHINQAYNSPDLSTRLIAAFTELALVRGRSMHGVLQARFSEGLPREEGDFLNLTEMCLTCIPPRRAKLQHFEAAINEHCQEPAEAICLNLESSTRCVGVLREAFARLRNPQTLADLWPHNATSPGQVFRDWVHDHPVLRRLTPGKLGTVAELDHYLAGGDWLQARLLYAAPGAALPAAASYSSYDGALLTATMAAWFAKPANSNAGGSLLAAPSDFYRTGFARLKEKIDQASGTDFFAFVSLSAIYFAQAFEAASGVRPADGVWMFKHMDGNTGVAFVDDDTGVDASAARWVQLPDAAVSLLKHLQNQHIPRVIAEFHRLFGESAAGLAQTFSSGICVLEQTDNGISAVPLKVAHRKHHRQDLATHPLPLNALRHRSRTIWRSLGMDVEVIDSQLGHSDGATRTHGSCSPRVWKQDFREALPVLNAAYADLHIQPPSVWQGLPSELATPFVPTVQHYPLEQQSHQVISNKRWRQLLVAARTTLSRLSIEAARKDPTLLPLVTGTHARLPIKELTRQAVTWAADEISALGKCLGSNEGGTPSATGMLRLLYLTRFADRCWINERTPLSLNRRTFRGVYREVPRASPYGIGAEERLRIWQSALASCRLATQKTHLSPNEGGVLLALSLALESRVTNRRLIEDAVRGEVRAVQHLSELYMEWTPDGQLPNHGHGVIRARVNKRCLGYLSTIKRSQIIHHSVQSPVPKSLRKFIATVGLQPGCKIAELLDIVLPTIDALNYLELPGNVAAARAGHILTVSRSWPDWTRTTEGAYKTIQPFIDELGEDEYVAEDAHETASVGSITGVQARRAAAEFVDELRTALMSFREGGVDRPVSPSQRRDLKRSIQSICNKYKGSVSSSLYLMGLWVAALFEKRRTKQLLKISSVRRYFQALAPRLEALAYELDYTSLSSEVLTELYSDALSFKKLQRPSYVAQRLREFDQFCSLKNCASPMWEEIGFQDIGIGVSPGFIDDNAYLRTFRFLGRHPTPSVARKAQLVALFSYRYGLRINEAAHLRVEDVVGPSRCVQVLVHRTEQRDLKTKRGRRVVPTIFQLEREETQLLRQTLTLGRERERLSPGSLLLASPDKENDTIDSDMIGKVVAHAMKEVCGNPFLSDHHLRHSFATKVEAALHAAISDADFFFSSEARRARLILLGEDRLTRRAAWALKVILGHSHPSVAQKSYVHDLHTRGDVLLGMADDGEFTDELTDSENEWFIDLDAAQWQYPGAGTWPGVAVKEAVSPRVVLLALSMLASGSNSTAVASSLGLDAQGVGNVSMCLNDLAERLKNDDPAKPDPRQPIVAARGLFAHIRVSALPRLNELLEQMIEQMGGNVQPFTGLPRETLTSMVSKRGQIAVWLPEQMSFLSTTTKACGLRNESLRLHRLERLDALVIHMACSRGLMAEGSVPSDPVSDSGGLSLATEVVPRLERTFYGHPRHFVEDRLALRVVSGDDEKLRNNYELILMLVAVWSYAQLSQDRLVVNGIADRP